MTTVIIANFAGMQPVLDASLLPDSNAQYSENTWLYRGLIRGFRHAALAHTDIYADTQQVYRIPKSTVNPPDFTDNGSVWLEYPDPFMATIRNPTINDQWNRYFFFPSDQYNSTGVNPSWPSGNWTVVDPMYASYNPTTHTMGPLLLLGIPVSAIAPIVVPASSNVTANATAATAPHTSTLTLNTTTGILVGMYISDTTVTTTTATAGAASATDTTVVYPTSTTGIVVGMKAANTTDPSTILSGTTVASIGTTTSTIATSAASTAGSTTLTFTSTAGITVGAGVADATTAAAIPTGTTVTAISAGTVTLSAAVVSPGVGSGDNITFTNHNTITLSTVVLSPGININDTLTFTNSNQIPTDAAVQSISGNTVVMNVNAAYAGVLAGDVLSFSTPTPESRAYVYTYVSAYGEEGPPSPPTLATGDPTGTWHVTVYYPTTADMTNRNLTNIRLYRTVTDSAGNATYYQVTQLPIPANAPSGGAAPVYADSALPAGITANQQLSTVDYFKPPNDLQGVVMMANGIAAGFSNTREIWFSAAYQLWSWPPAYALSVEYPIVGLSAQGSSLSVLTEGPPYIISGITPNTMTVAKISANEPCIGRGSIAKAAEATYYASPNGVFMLSPAGDTSMTQTIYEKEFHFSLLPWNWASGRYGDSYVIFVKGNGIPAIDPDGDVLNGLVIDNQNTNVPFSFLHFLSPVVNLYQDEFSGQLFGILANNTVMQWNPPIGVPGSTTLWNWEWKSKRFRFTAPQQFKAFLVFFDIPPEVTITLGPRNQNPNQTFDPTKQYLIVQVYGDGQLLTTREVQVSGEVLLINNGSKWTYWEVRLQGQVQVRMFKMASTVKELKAA